MLGNWEKSDTMLSAIDRHTVHQVTCLLNITHKTEKASTTSVIWCVVLFPFTHFSFLCSYWTPCYGCAKLVVTLRQSEEVFYQCRKGMLNACNNHKFSFIVAMLVFGWLIELEGIWNIRHYYVGMMTFFPGKGMLLLTEQVHIVTGMIIISRSPSYSMISLIIFFFISDQMIKVLLEDKSDHSFFLQSKFSHAIAYLLLARTLSFPQINDKHFTFWCNQIICCSKSWVCCEWQLTPLAAQPVVCWIQCFIKGLTNRW